MEKVERESDRYVKDKWYKNIWYHHKLPIIIALFLVLTISLLIYTSLTKSNIDIHVLYITADPEVYSEKVFDLQNTLMLYAEDWSEDGKINVFVENIFVGSYHETDITYENKERIMTLLRSGSCFLILTDDVGLQYMESSDALCDLSEEIPDAQLSGDFVNLNDYPFLQNPTITDWDRSLYMSLRRYKGTIAELSAQTQINFEKARTIFVNIINDTKPYLRDKTTGESTEEDEAN